MLRKENKSPLANLITRQRSVGFDPTSKAKFSKANFPENQQDTSDITVLSSPYPAEFAEAAALSVGNELTEAFEFQAIAEVISQTVAKMAVVVLASVEGAAGVAEAELAVAKEVEAENKAAQDEAMAFAACELEAQHYEKICDGINATQIKSQKPRTKIDIYFEHSKDGIRNTFRLPIILLDITKNLGYVTYYCASTILSKNRELASKNLRLNLNFLKDCLKMLGSVAILPLNVLALVIYCILKVCTDLTAHVLSVFSHNKPHQDNDGVVRNMGGLDPDDETLFNLDGNEGFSP